MSRTTRATSKASGASLKNLFDRGLLYQGHKIVWWWAQGGTALSAGEVGQGYREVADPSVYVRFPLVERRRPAEPDDAACWSGPPRLGRCRATSSRPCIRNWNTPSSTIRRSRIARLIVAAALVETLAAKVKRELKSSGPCKGSELVGRRYVPPFRLLLRRRSATAARRRCKTGGEAARRLARRGGRVRHDRQRHRRRASGAGVRRSRFSTCCMDEQQRFRDRRRAAVDLRRRPRWQVHRRSARLSRPLGQRCRQRHLARAAASRAALSSRAISARISVLLAGRAGSADPVSAQSWFIRTTAVQRCRCSSNNRADQLAAGAYPRRPVRQLSGIERRLGPLARALLGHAAADLGLRSRPAIMEAVGQLRRTAGKAGRAGHRSLGRGQSRRIPIWSTT